MTTIYVPRVFGGTLILNVTLLPPFTSGPVSMILADQLVNSAQIADIQRAQVLLDDRLVDTALLTEKVV